MPFQITQSTPYGENIHSINFIQLIEAKTFAEIFMINEDDSLNNPNRKWFISENGPFKGNHIIDVHSDYSIIVKEIK